MTNSKKSLPDIRDLTREQLITWLKDKNIAPYRSDQILKWINIRQSDDFDSMTDLGKNLRAALSASFTIGRLRILKIGISKDGSKKFLFRLKDGNKIESVLIPEKDHYTLCISSQAGCAQGCRFCLTSKGGFKRNLSLGEITAQVRDISNHLGPDNPKRLKNIVFMGMGEPLANYNNVVNALKIITDGNTGLKFSPRRVTISTSGLVPALKLLGRDMPDVNLAISLNATDNKTRDMIMPINKRYPIEALIEACKNYPLKPRQRITFEYVLLKRINDSTYHAKTLAGLLRPVKSKINLIPFNEYEGSEFRRPDRADTEKFLKILLDHNYTAIIRHSKGRDISAACGQLSGQYAE